MNRMEVWFKYNRSGKGKDLPNYLGSESHLSFIWLNKQCLNEYKKWDFSYWTANVGMPIFIANVYLPLAMSELYFVANTYLSGC